MIHPSVAALWSAQAVRDRCGEIYQLTMEGLGRHFELHLDELDGTAQFVVETMCENYPDLEIPYHSRWRHFSAGDIPRWENAVDARMFDPIEMGRIRTELTILSVLLDAGAGEHWRYREATTGRTLARSEGLAVASLHAYLDGIFSADRKNHLRADAQAMSDFDISKLHRYFQVDSANPLAGAAGRVSLVRNLATAVQGNRAVFGEPEPRLGQLYDHLRGTRTGNTIAAPTVLKVLLELFSGIWPGRVQLHGTGLGDVWHHRSLVRNDETTGLVPFHKLSQWMTYSLLEVMEDSGLKVGDIDGLTGLPEYRNGGLFIDTGVLEVKDPEVLSRAHHPEEELVVEWRALTVALLDRVTECVREKLNLDTGRLPLARVLQGGTWNAGRKIALQRRPGGVPPLTIVSDGTVF